MRWEQTEFSFLRPDSSYSGEILDISSRGQVSAWSIDNALSHKNLRMQIALYHEGELIYQSKIKRSFIVDREITSSNAPRLTAIGTHGYRHKIPRAVINSIKGEPAEIELRIFADRAGKQDYYATRYDLSL